MILPLVKHCLSWSVKKLKKSRACDKVSDDTENALPQQQKTNWIRSKKLVNKSINTFYEKFQNIDKVKKRMCFFHEFLFDIKLSVLSVNSSFIQIIDGCRLGSPVCCFSRIFIFNIKDNVDISAKLFLNVMIMTYNSR